MWLYSTGTKEYCETLQQDLEERLMNDSQILHDSDQEQPMTASDQSESRISRRPQSAGAALHMVRSDQTSRPGSHDENKEPSEVSVSCLLNFIKYFGTC